MAKSDPLFALLTLISLKFPRCFIAADMRGKDEPLVIVNDHFMNVTGYDRRDILGKNCRFLQNDKTNPETIKRLRQSLNNGECCYYNIMNSKQDGTEFWNRLVLVPIGLSQSEVRYYVGIQMDVTSKYKDGAPKNFTQPSDEINKYVKSKIDILINGLREYELLFFSSEDDVETKKEKILESVQESILDICSYVEELP